MRSTDLFFISNQRLDPAVEVPGFYEVVPDLAVEIVSPGDAYTEVMEKVAEYLTAGVRLVWVVDTRRRSITVYPGAQTLSEQDVLSGGDVLPGFAVPLSRLFRSC